MSHNLAAIITRAKNQHAYVLLCGMLPLTY